MFQYLIDYKEQYFRKIELYLTEDQKNKIKKEGVQKWVSVGADSFLSGVEFWERGRGREGGGNF